MKLPFEISLSALIILVYEKIIFLIEDGYSKFFGLSNITLQINEYYKFSKVFIYIFVIIVPIIINKFIEKPIKCLFENDKEDTGGPVFLSIPIAALLMSLIWNLYYNVIAAIVIDFLYAIISILVYYLCLTLTHNKKIYIIIFFIIFHICCIFSLFCCSINLLFIFVSFMYIYYIVYGDKKESQSNNNIKKIIKPIVIILSFLVIINLNVINYENQGKELATNLSSKEIIEISDEKYVLLKDNDNNNLVVRIIYETTDSNGNIIYKIEKGKYQYIETNGLLIENVECVLE